MWWEFSVQDREIGSVFLSVWIWYVSRDRTVHNIICQEYSLGGKEELLWVILGLSLHAPKVMEEPVLPAPTLSHTVVQCRVCVSVCLCMSVSVCPESCARLQGWILRSYRSVCKITLFLWRRLAPAVGWIIPTPPPSVFLSVCLSFLGLGQINHCLKFSDVFFFSYRNLWVSLQIIRGRICLYQCKIHYLWVLSICLSYTQFMTSAACSAWHLLSLSERTGGKVGLML